MGNIILFFLGKRGQFPRVADILIERLEEEIARQRFNYKSLSLAAGLGETTVRDIVIGRARNPRRDTLQKIARTLGLPLSYFLGDGTSASVPVLDTGRPAGRASLRGVREHALPAPGCDFVEIPPEAGYANLAAVRLRGDSMMPFLPGGSVLYYNERREDGFDAFLEQLCVVQIKNGPLSVHILRRGALYGKFDLASYNAKTLENADIEWCAKALFIRLP
jgi:transcriptional regulator with XRE-family HTH domain